MSDLDNRWNKKIYKMWAPVYDYIFNSGAFLVARKKVFEDIQVKSKQKVLFIGVGTGSDIPFLLGKDVEITGIDLSPDMLQKAQNKYDSLQITLIEMDAQDLKFPSNSYDLIIANLILSVVPDSQQCLREMIRVTCDGGRIVIFDKFTRENEGMSFIQKALRPVVGKMGTDIGRSFEQITEPLLSHIAVEEDVPVLFNGMYRKIVLRKIG